MKKKIKVRTKFIFLLGLVLTPGLIYAQELKVLQHIPAEEIESSFYDAAFAGTAVWYPVLTGYNLTISPDGRFIAFWSARNLSVKVMELETKKVIAELDDVDIKNLKKETSVELEKLPEGVRFPDSLKEMVRYDATKRTLVFKGIMKKEEKDELLKLSPKGLYQKAVERLFQRSQTTPIQYLTFTPDSRFLAIVLGDAPLLSVPSLIKIWDFIGTPSLILKQADVDKKEVQQKGETAQRVITLSLPPLDKEDYGVGYELPHIAFSIDGKYLATPIGTRIHLWSTANWEVIKTLKSPIPYGGRGLINQLAFSPDTRYLVSRIGSQISVWELYETVETEEWKKWDEQATKCEMGIDIEKANRSRVPPPPTPLEEKAWEERLKKCRENEPLRYVTIFNPRLFLPDIRSPHKVGGISKGSPLVFSPDGRYLITGVFRFDFTPDEWKAQLEKGVKPEELNANFQRFSGGAGSIAVYGDLVAMGAWGDKEATASIFSLSGLKELASFSTVKDRKRWPEDVTHLIFFFPDGKRLFTYNNREGIYIFDISTLKK